MSLIVGQYYRGDPKQKPKQWGSVSTVQTTVFNNAEKIGINPSNIPIAIPFWELAGNIPYNYGQLGNPTLTGSYNWQDDGLRLNYSDGLLTIPYGESLINNTAATAVFGVLINKNAELGSDALNIVNSLFGKGIYSYASLTPSYYKRAVIRIFGTSTDSTPSIVNSPVDTKLNFCFSWDRGYAETLLKGQDFFDRKTEEAYTDIIPTTGTTDVQIGGSGDAVFNMLCVVNDTVNSDFLIANPYYLFQPPTFRTYFDLASSSSLAITDTPDLINAISYPVVSSETSVGLDPASNIVVNGAPLLGIDGCAADDNAWVVNATGLIIDAVDQATAVDPAAFVNTSGVPIQCILGNILYDAAQLANAVSIITQAPGSAIANDICSGMSSAATALTNASYASAIDTAVPVLAQGWVIPSSDIGFTTDATALANASATAIAAMVGNYMLDAAHLSQAGVVILAAVEIADANGYGAITAVPSAVLVSDAQAAAIDAAALAGATGWVLQGVERLSVADYAGVMAAQGLTSNAIETLALTDPADITLVNAWILTAATASDHDINAIFGTPVLVPVLSGRPVLHNKLQGTILIIRR